MKKTSIVKAGFFTIIAISLVFIIFVLPDLKEKGGVKIKVSKIRQEYVGVITDKYSVRDTPPTHIKIKTEDDSLEVSPNRQIVENSDVGDSIIKPKDENYVFILKSNGNRSKFYYTKLSNETRNSKYFPKEWRKK